MNSGVINDMTEQNEKNNIKTSSILKIGLVSLFAILFFSAFVMTPPSIESVTAAPELNEDHTVTLTVTMKDGVGSGSGQLWCYLGEIQNAAEIPEDAWVEAVDGQATFDVMPGTYYVFARDRQGNVSRYNEEDAAINTVVAIDLNYEELYLPLDDERQFEASLFALGDADHAIEWSTSNADVATIEDGKLRTHSPGEVTVTATAENGLQATATVVVTDLFHKPVLEDTKQVVPAFYYSPEEAKLLDLALASRIAEAGYGTRAGAVAAARFLALEFPFRIPYFFENGRLVNHFNRHVDGEGRYYHIGLYLSADKYDDISAIFAGPAIWGEPLMNFQDEGSFRPGVKYPNGLDCSGYITWALLNGGFDVGDVGAGDYYYRDDDLCDLGERVPLTVELIESGRIKVGDLIGQDGHIAMIVGMTDEYIYIAESSGPGVRVVELSWYYGVFNFGKYDYVMLMDSVYEDDGNLTNIW